MVSEENAAVADRLYKKAMQISKGIHPGAMLMPDDRAVAFGICAAISELLTPMMFELEKLRKRADGGT